ncbi:MAG TPA: hypothetical protein VFF47_04415 [Nitrospirota bacterium]|nr:hypothetical protein [Nitrospirota bacterium]
MTRRHSLIVILLLFVLLNPLIVLAADVDEKDKSLQFDQPVEEIREFNFKQDKAIKPKPNNIKLINSSFMSNKVGERWAFVTIENTSSGRRFFVNHNIVATFADGSQSRAYDLEETIEGGSKRTIAIFFGIHKFPIVLVDVEE